MVGRPTADLTSEIIRLITEIRDLSDQDAEGLSRATGLWPSSIGSADNESLDLDSLESYELLVELENLIGHEVITRLPLAVITVGDLADAVAIIGQLP